ncbi:MAG: TIGR00153 family protein [Verrucomicrobia bacterium]|nr:TIGR00153 family protein [Kiritimatiellia bacterium]MCO6399876.1 TIGR00153 family protein [Verrucomicrobiota bacterium]
MRSLNKLFGESPFPHVVEHSRKIHQCVNLIRPISDAIVAGDMDRLRALQDDMSRTEYEADQIKDSIRQNLPKRFFLPVNRGDILKFTRQLDRMADDAEDFAVVSTFRKLELDPDLRTDFLALVNKVTEVSELLLAVAEDLAHLQMESFEGTETDRVLAKINQVCHMEWETDKLSRRCARRYYSSPGMDAVTIILLEKLCKALTGIADHAENVGKNLRLMIVRR